MQAENKNGSGNFIRDAATSPLSCSVLSEFASGVRNAKLYDFSPRSNA